VSFYQNYHKNYFGLKSPTKKGKLHMDQSRLLINEPPLLVLPSLAAAIGLNEAIVIQQLHYRLQNPKTGALNDGLKWEYSTYEEWQQVFTFWSARTIQRVFLDLEKRGLIVSAQFDKSGYDRRKYYRINYDQLRMIDSANLSSSMVPTLASSLIGITKSINNNDKDDAAPKAKTSTTPNVFALYESEIGQLTPMVAEKLKDAEQAYSEQWVLDAIELAVEHNKRNWKYCEAILKNCKTKNIRPKLNRLEAKHANQPNTKKRATQPKPEKTDYTDDDRKAAERVRQRKAGRMPTV